MKEMNNVNKTSLPYKCVLMTYPYKSFMKMNVLHFHT